MAEQVHIFVSYARNQYKLAKEVFDNAINIRQFQHQKIKYKPIAWFDDYITPGENWDDEIKCELQKADVVIFLLSKCFLESEYIIEHELKFALERHEQSKISLLLLYLRIVNFKIPY